MKYPELTLRPNSQRLLLQGHPWVYSGAVARHHPDAAPGDIVDVRDSRGRFVGRGHYNPRSTIAVRILTRQAASAIDGQFLKRALTRAIRLRRQNPLLAETNACRLVYGESDGLPGLIVDEYAGYFVVQLHSLGMDQLRAEVIDALSEVGRPQGIFERSDVGTRRAEGMPDRPSGPLAGSEPPDLIEIREHGVSLLVDIRRGQKTGFFLDQRDNRCLLGRLAAGQSVLNCFSYTGGFSAHAVKGGATRTLDVDISSDALLLARQNLAANAPGTANSSLVAADAFSFVDELAERQPRFDIVVVDPPSLVRKARDLKRATGVYIKLNRNALKLVRDGGLVMTSSCSSRISEDDFFHIVRRAAASARVNVRILASNLHPPDHPVDPAFPEGRYLKSILARVFHT